MVCINYIFNPRKTSRKTIPTSSPNTSRTMRTYDENKGRKCSRAKFKRDIPNQLFTNSELSKQTNINLDGITDKRSTIFEQRSPVTSVTTNLKFPERAIVTEQIDSDPYIRNNVQTNLSCKLITDEL